MRRVSRHICPLRDADPVDEGVMPPLGSIMKLGKEEVNRKIKILKKARTTRKLVGY